MALLTFVEPTFKMAFNLIFSTFYSAFNTHRQTKQKTIVTVLPAKFCLPCIRHLQSNSQRCIGTVGSPSHAVQRTLWVFLGLRTNSYRQQGIPDCIQKITA